MLVFLFASLAIRVVRKAAPVVIADVRDQFANDTGILAGTSRPNYGRTVDIVTKSALRQMIFARHFSGRSANSSRIDFSLLVLFCRFRRVSG